MSDPVDSSMIPEVFEAHLREFAFLWSQMHDAMRSPDFVPNDLVEFARRVEAHLDGLIHVREAAIPGLEEQLSSDEAEALTAASYVLLCLRSPKAAELVLQEFFEADPGRMASICHALCRGPQEHVVDTLSSALSETHPRVAVAAAEALAFHGKLDAIPAIIAACLTDEDPQIRRSAWRVIALSESIG